MKRMLALCALAGLMAAPVLAESVKGEWTGYITDSHCGAKGANKNHTAACVEKCMKSGSKAQIQDEADNTIYDLDSFEKVKSLMGDRVTVTGTLDSATKTITVESAAKAAAKPAAE